MEEKISREELIKLYKIEISFFDQLEESGLIKPQLQDNIKYLLFEDLAYFEKLTSWHYDLDVNIAGLEVIDHLMQRIERLQAENRKFLQKFSDSIGHFEDIDWK